MKQNLLALGAIGAVMFGAPWAAVTFAPGDAGMAICFILFFGVNTTVSMFMGVFAGLQPKLRWFLPVVNAAAFLLGAWTVFDWGNPDFYGFTAAYLAIASGAALVTTVLVRKNQNNQ